MTVLTRDLTRKRVLSLLHGWAPEGAPSSEMRGYVQESAGRFAATARALMSLPKGARVLEIGANPYFLTTVMRHARPDLDWLCTNCHDDAPLVGIQEARVVNDVSGEQRSIRWVHANVERDPLPFPEHEFDVVVYCEVLEHLVEDPVRSIEHIRRVLRPEGLLVLTTPNPARIYNIWKLLAQRSIHDQFSAYGIYGRHNREYSRSELETLLAGVGFRLESAATVETSTDLLFRRVLARLGYGQHHLLLARRTTAAPRRYRPSWLYRSYPSEFFAE